jgi:ABC-type transport system involved in Fe-S cluster assembly fused permease/ATPase subunit
LNIGQNIIFTIGSSVNLMMAAYDVSNGRLTPGDFVMIQAFFLQLAGPLFNMGTLFREIDQSQVDVEDLYFMLHHKSAVQEKENAIDYNFEKGRVVLNNVSFKHLKNSDKDDGQMIHRNDYLFKDLSLVIEPGTTNAIVGQSGFGKTTIFNLIVKFICRSDFYFVEQTIRPL